jgi:hypothetical protein
MQRKNDAHKDELEGVAQRLRNERPEASPLELDRIKMTAMSRAQAGTRRGRAGTRRLAVASLTVGLLAAGTGGVIASAGSSQTHGNAAVAQYGSNCDTNNGNNIGSGNGNKDGNGNGNSNFASYLGHSSKGKGKDSGSGGNNSSGNGNGNGVGNGTENGNESGNGSNNFNCNENSFNTTENNITETVTNTVTNNYYATTITFATPAPPAASGVQAASTTKKATTSSRRIKIHINVPRKAKLSKVTLKVNGKVVSVLKGKKASANINLVNLPCSANGTTVTITAVTNSGKKITQSHTYHLC